MTMANDKMKKEKSKAMQTFENWRYYHALVQWQQITAVKYG